MSSHELVYVVHFAVRIAMLRNVQEGLEHPNRTQILFNCSDQTGVWERCARKQRFPLKLGDRPRHLDDVAHRVGKECDR